MPQNGNEAQTSDEDHEFIYLPPGLWIRLGGLLISRGYGSLFRIVNQCARIWHSFCATRIHERQSPRYLDHDPHGGLLILCTNHTGTSPRNDSLNFELLQITPPGPGTMGAKSLASVDSDVSKPQGYR